MCILIDRQFCEWVVCIEFVDWGSSSVSHTMSHIYHYVTKVSVQKTQFPHILWEFLKPTNGLWTFWSKISYRRHILLQMDGNAFILLWSWPIGHCQCLPAQMEARHVLNPTSAAINRGNSLIVLNHIADTKRNMFKIIDSWQNWEKICFALVVSMCAMT